MSFQSKLKTALKQFLLCGLHAVFMMLICFAWLSLDYNVSLEKGFVQLSSIIKRTFINDTTNYARGFAFIDVSKTKKLIPADDGPGYDVITDRAKLDSFFRIINKVSNSDYKYIVCDVLLDKPSPDDSGLQKTLDDTRKIVLPYSQDENKILQPVITNTEVGYAGYKTSYGLYSVQEFLKYELIQDESLKGIPTIVYGQVNGADIEKRSGLVWINGKPSINHIVLDQRLRSENMIDTAGNSKIYSFEEVMNLLSVNDSLFYKKLLANKIIVIGDYENDLHQTAIGVEPGPLILTNIYLSLLYGDNLITAGWLLYVFVCFWILSWLIFYKQKWIKKTDAAIEEIPVIGTVLEITVFIAVVWIVSLVSYIYLNHYLDILILVVYLGLLNSVIEYVQKRKAHKPVKRGL